MSVGLRLSSKIDYNRYRYVLKWKRHFLIHPLIRRISTELHAGDARSQARSVIED